LYGKEEAEEYLGNVIVHCLKEEIFKKK